LDQHCTEKIHCHERDAIYSRIFPTAQKAAAVGYNLLAGHCRVLRAVGILPYHFTCDF
jgi:hypothetical protein